MSLSTTTNLRALLNKLSRNLGTIKEAINLENSAHDLGLNTLMESRIMKIYNLTSGYEFNNANLFEHNYPAVDGIDEENKIMVQVTSTFSNDKIEHTLKKVIEHNLYEKYSRLIIIFLKDKKKLSSSIKEKLKGLINEKFAFDPEKDIVDLKDIYREFYYKQDIEKVHHAATLLDEVLNYIPDYSFSGYAAVSVCFHDEELDNVFNLVDAIIKEGINVYLSSKKLVKRFEERGHPLRDFIIPVYPTQSLDPISLCITVLSNAYINQIGSTVSTQNDMLYTHALENETKMEYVSFDSVLKEWKNVRDKIKYYRSVQGNLPQVVKVILSERLKEAAFGNISMDEIKEELISAHPNFTPVVTHKETDYIILNLTMRDQEDLQLNYLILSKDFVLNQVAIKVKAVVKAKPLKNLNVLVPKNFSQKTRRRLEGVKNVLDNQRVYYVDEHLFDKRFKSLKQTPILSTSEFVSPVVRHSEGHMRINDIIHWIFNNSDSSVAIINGSGGIGKTTVCQKIHDLIIKEQSSIAIFVDASQYIDMFRKKANNGDTEYDIYNIVKACHPHAATIDRNSFYTNYSLGNIIIIFDGIDEIISTIPSFDIYKFLENLENLMVRLGKGKILINCRDNYISDVKKFYEDRPESKIQIYELLGFSEELARVFFSKHYDDEELVRSCLKLVKEFFPEVKDDVYKYPPFILEIVIQIVSENFEYEDVSADFDSKILQPEEPNDVVIYRVCYREFIKKEKYGFQLDIDQQVRFLSELAVEEKGEILKEDFSRMLENMGLHDRVNEVAKGLYDHPLIIREGDNYTFRFNFFNMYFKSVAIFNMLATDMLVQFTERLITILAYDCNYNSVISKYVVSKAKACDIPFFDCLQYSKIVIEKIRTSKKHDNREINFKMKKAISNILVMIITSKDERFSNERIIKYIFGKGENEINGFYFIDVPQFAGIKFDFSGWYFTSSEINNYGSFFECRFDTGTFFDDTCTISNVYISKNWKGMSASLENFDRNIKGDNSLFRVMTVKLKGENELKRYFREYLGSFNSSKQFSSVLLENSISVIEDDFVTVGKLTKLMKAEGIVLKNEKGTVYLDERLKFKILRFLSQGLLFSQLSRCIHKLKNEMLGDGDGSDR